MTEEIKETRFHVTGASVLPPQGYDWHYEIVSPARVIFGKLVGNNNQSLAALVVAHKLPRIENESDFISKVGEVCWEDKPSDNYNLLYQNAEISSEKSAMCLRMDRSSQEFNSKYAPENVQYLIVREIWLVCQHPESKEIGVSFGFSERSPPGWQNKHFEDEADFFFRNARLEKLDISNR